MSSSYDASSGGTTFTLEQYPDPAALIGGFTTYPLSFPHPIEVVSQTVGTSPWPQTVKYTGSPISALVYSPSNPTYDKNTLPPIDIFSGKYDPTAHIPQAPAIAIPSSSRQYADTSAIPWWEYAVIGGISVGVIVLLLWYALSPRRGRGGRLA